ncbi:MAG: hypothetical protein NTX72_01940 [Candidatus Uhrbacteria bacterium]|nr:hypothetical protein [Candidatus Uhrbacteria bacterium]
MERAPQGERRDQKERREVVFTPAVLNVEEPDGIHNSFGIMFDAVDEPQCRSYRLAIRKIADAEKLLPFHQGGSNEKMGWQYFEFFAQTSKDAVLALFPKIHEKAKEEFDTLKRMGFFE